jgi:hypothetical protein
MKPKLKKIRVKQAEKLTKLRTSLEALTRVRDDIRSCRVHLTPQLEASRADFGNLIAFFEAKFNELERKILAICEDLIEEEKVQIKKKARK